MFVMCLPAGAELYCWLLSSPSARHVAGLPLPVTDCPVSCVPVSDFQAGGSGGRDDLPAPEQWLFHWPDLRERCQGRGAGV